MGKHELPFSFSIPYNMCVFMINASYYYYYLQQRVERSSFLIIFYKCISYSTIHRLQQTTSLDSYHVMRIYIHLSGDNLILYDKYVFYLCITLLFLSVNNITMFPREAANICRMKKILSHAKHKRFFQCSKEMT